MTRFVLDPAAALRIVEEAPRLDPAHALLAPALLRSHVLARLYERVRTGALAEADGLGINARFARLELRYLGDAVLRRRAWAIAASLGAETTYGAEYLALTALQADALVALDPDLARLADGVVPTAPFEALLA